MLNVLPTTEALEIANAAALTPSVLGGSCHVEVISAYPGLYKKLVVTAPDGIQTETSATPGNVIYLEYHQTGTYTIRAIASMQEDFSADTALYSTQPMSIAVDSNPQIDSISHDGETGDYGLHYTDEAMFLIVRNTFVADSVAVYEGDSLLCVGERSQYDNYWYSFDCTIPANTLTAGKHELTLRAYFDDEEMTSPIAEVKYIVYMIEGVNDSTQYYLSRSATLLTGSPEKSSGIIQPAGTPAVKVGVYGALSYVRIGNTHGFVSVDLVTAWTDEGNDIWIDPELCMVYADGALAHQSSIRAGTSPVWYAPVQANHTFRLYTEEALDHLSLNIFFVDMNGEQTVVTDSAQTTFADGYVDVFLPAHTSGGKSGTYQFYYAAGNNLPNQLIILTVYEPVEDVRFIYPKSEYLELRDCVYVTPLRIYGVFSMEAVYYTYPVSLCGTLGDEWYFVHYVESGIDIYRWVPAILTLPEKNETITRVYLLVTDHLYNGKSSEQKTADKTLVLFKNLFSSYLSDPSNLYVDTEITAQEMDRLFRTIGFQTDFNDKTYLYLLGHGKDDQDNSKLITHLDSEQNLVGIGYRKLTQEFFSRLNGEAVIFVQSCYGGWIVQWAQEVLDPERISIVTSCAKNEGSIFAKTFPTPFGSDLLESCTSSSPAADANHDGLITLKELFDSNVWRYLWLMTEYQEEHTQIFGNEDNLVFSVPE